MSLSIDFCRQRSKRGRCDNGFTGAAMQQAGEWILSTPELWIANVWNTDHTMLSVLTGDRLTAYRATKADPRAMR